MTFLWIRTRVYLFLQLRLSYRRFCEWQLLKIWLGFQAARRLRRAIAPTFPKRTLVCAIETSAANTVVFNGLSTLVQHDGAGPWKHRLERRYYDAWWRFSISYSRNYELFSVDSCTIERPSWHHGRRNRRKSRVKLRENFHVRGGSARGERDRLLCFLPIFCLFFFRFKWEIQMRLPWVSRIVIEWWQLNL